jgi:hypothetical protein
MLAHPVTQNIDIWRATAENVKQTRRHNQTAVYITQVALFVSFTLIQKSFDDPVSTTDVKWLKVLSAVTVSNG